ncbi:MAG: hypothetical protein P8M21_00475 [Halioglobus sp.]|nr:hypothetical protein [Halioglobus sp.]
MELDQNVNKLTVLMLRGVEAYVPGQHKIREMRFSTGHRSKKPQ